MESKVKTDFGTLNVKGVEGKSYKFYPISKNISEVLNTVELQ